jgi:hypothetical protein
MQNISKEDLINIVAAALAAKFLPALQTLNSKKNYYSYVGNLAEILGWAKDFCERYYEMVIEADGPARSHIHCHYHDILEPLFLTFGRQRLLSFYKQNAMKANYLVEK